MSSFKKSLIRRLKERNNHFFSSIRFSREYNLDQNKKNHSWANMNYKIYPSSLSSLHMCPKRFIEEDVHKAPGFNIDLVYRMEVGTYLHRMYQDEAVKLKSLIWDKPDLSTFYKDTGLSTSSVNLHEKLQNNWPEVPVYHPCGISGRADLILNIDNEPVVFDIKTTTKEKTLWKDYKNTLPLEPHKIQVGIYIYLMNKYKYYTKKITKGSLGYVNLAMIAGEEGSEHEVMFDYTEEMEDSIGKLILELERQKIAYLSSTKVDCQYPLCRIKHDINTIPESE